MIPADDPGELDWSATLGPTIRRPPICAEEFLFREERARDRCCPAVPVRLNAFRGPRRMGLATADQRFRGRDKAAQHAVHLARWALTLDRFINPWSNRFATGRALPRPRIIMSVFHAITRLEERRVGKECVSTVSS